ncbi:MAG: hypothetical protein RXS42_07615 [Nitrososphaeria archaeon]
MSGADAVMVALRRNGLCGHAHVAWGPGGRERGLRVLGPCESVREAALAGLEAARAAAGVVGAPEVRTPNAPDLQGVPGVRAARWRNPYALWLSVQLANALDAAAGAAGPRPTPLTELTLRPHEVRAVLGAFAARAVPLLLEDEELVNAVKFSIERHRSAGTDAAGEAAMVDAKRLVALRAHVAVGALLVDVQDLVKVGDRSEITPEELADSDLIIELNPGLDLAALRGARPSEGPGPHVPAALAVFRSRRRVREVVVAAVPGPVPPAARDDFRAAVENIFGRAAAAALEAALREAGA